MTELISGTAYGERATLEVSGETLTWRARPGGELPENIATSVHDVREGYYLEQKASIPGIALIALGGLWIYRYGWLEGLVATLAGAGLVVWRRMKPRRMLVLELGPRRLVMNVDAASVPHARALVARIDRALASGEAPASPPTLP